MSLHTFYSNSETSIYSHSMEIEKFLKFQKIIYTLCRKPVYVHSKWNCFDHGSNVSETLTFYDKIHHCLFAREKLELGKSLFVFWFHGRTYSAISSIISNNNLFIQRIKLLPEKKLLPNNPILNGYPCFLIGKEQSLRPSRCPCEDRAV